MDARLKQILLEKQKRAIVLPELVGNQPAQTAFILDESRRKCALVGRRGGKSTANGICMARAGIQHPKSTITFITMTFDTCYRILIKDIMEPLNERFNLKLKIMSETVEFPNGSIIYMVGIDQSEKEKNKLLGQKQRLCVLDEAQDLTIDTRDLIDRVLKHSLTDLKGQLIMTGTASDSHNTYFYEMTKEYKNCENWSFHTWLAWDNPELREQILEEIAEEKKLNPNIESTPLYQQHRLAKWTISNDALIYRPKPINFEYLPPTNIDDWIYILGVDLGYKDADAFAVVKFSYSSKLLFVEEIHVQAGNDDIASGLMIKRLMQRLKFSRIVIDAAALKSVETMRQRMALPLESAAKTGKADHIRLFNMDLDAGIIRFSEQAGAKWSEEAGKLIWDPKKPGKEKEGLPNHACDAVLYAWRAASNWSFQEVQEEKLTPEEQADREFDNIISYRKNSYDELENQLSANNIWNQHEYFDFE